MQDADYDEPVIPQTEVETSEVTVGIRLDELIRPFRDIVEIAEREKGGENPLLNFARSAVSTHEETDAKIERRYSGSPDKLVDVQKHLAHSLDRLTRNTKLASEGRKTFEPITREQALELNTLVLTTIDRIKDKGTREVDEPEVAPEEYPRDYVRGVYDITLEGSGDEGEEWELATEDREASLATLYNPHERLHINYRLFNSEGRRSYRCDVIFSSGTVSLDLYDITGISPHSQALRTGIPGEVMYGLSPEPPVQELRSYEYQLIKFILERINQQSTVKEDEAP